MSTGVFRRRHESQLYRQKPFIPTAPGLTHYTLACEPGSYVVTGSDANLLAARILAADPGSYVITGSALTPLVHRLLNADPGVYNVVGSDANFPRTYVLQATPGQYNVFGFDATLEYSAAPAVENEWYIVMRRRRR